MTTPTRPLQPAHSQEAAGDPVVRVLIVDDDAGKRTALKAILLPLGHHLVEASSGIAALRCLLKQSFAIVLLDVKMPAMSGFETAGLIRSRQKSEMTPIIFITAYGPDEITHADAYAEGAVDFIFAPVDPNELRSKVSVFANLYVKAERHAMQTRAAQAAIDELRVLTDAAPIGIFHTDAEDRYTYTNPRWTEITGISTRDALGRKWHSIIAAGDSEVDHESRSLAESCSRFEIIRPDAESRTVMLTWRPVSDVDRYRSGWVGTLADVTSEAGAEASLSRARDAALVAKATQQDFTASASHELRTPTTTILGFVEEILQNDALSEEDHGFLEIVHRNALRLNRLIDDLLILDKTEVDASMMRVEATDVLALVDRVVFDFAAIAQCNEITLTTEHPEQLVRVWADPLRLEQALTNLIGNALKFTPKGGRVMVGVGSDENHVRFTVTDTGPGLHPDEVDRIFDRFYRGRTALDTAVKGSGLGLAIAKGMIAAQNGRIDVVSEPGKGCTFTISLPIAEDGENS